MAEFGPSPEEQIGDIFRTVVTGTGRALELMTNDKVAEASETATYILHDAQLEGVMDLPTISEGADPIDQANAIIRRAVGNETLKGWLGDSSDPA
jgi:hypothetical protein